LEEDVEPYANGALFGFDPTTPPEEQSDEWVISVTPSAADKEDGKLASSAWKHTEVRHMTQDDDS
jgi:hypothetical protein